ncbi:MAG: leucine-rich repeat domain-containing protein [Cyclobacteriaceae bacterium]|nr:leucine-rich repeat domain-containing protein [Cyclobacteriaceae bacterium]
MKNLMPALLVLSLAASAYGQRVFSALEEPVFSSPKDSIRYSEINRAMRDAMEQRSTFPDSLMDEFRSIRNRITGFRRHYKSSPGFITLDSLAKIQDKSQVKLLSITNWKSRRMPGEVYACTHLQELELVNTRISHVKGLKKFSSLTGLYLLNNKPKGRLALSKSRTIRSVAMRGNALSLPRSFAPVQALERLDLAASGLTAFPKGLTRNKGLKELILTNNAIADLGNLPGLPALEKLELIRNKIESIPESISNLVNLKQLTLNYNSVKSVHPAIGKLTRLEQLSLYNNKLTAIPDGLYNLPALREIDLYHNEIERVDDRIANLKNLEILYLSHNRLISIPASIGSLSKLNELYLSNNRLVELPATISQLQNLKVMRVNHNRLINSLQSLASFAQLENLDISENQLSELPAGLDGLPALKILVMVNNPWDESSRKQIPAVIRSLRSKAVVVHVNGELED